MRLLLTMAALLASCSSSTRIAVGGQVVAQCELPAIVAASANLSPVEREAVRAAAEQWPGSFLWGGTVPWAPDSPDAPPGGMVVIVGRPQGDYSSRGVPAYARLMVDPRTACIRDAAVYVFSDSITVDIIAHELGHALGLSYHEPHLEAPHG